MTLPIMLPGYRTAYKHWAGKAQNCGECGGFIALEMPYYQVFENKDGGLKWVEAVCVGCLKVLKVRAE